jgi:hypothetical protein
MRRRQILVIKQRLEEKQPEQKVEFNPEPKKRGRKKKELDNVRH